MECKAIILVAGMGTRLKPRTLSTHKCLTKVNGKPIIKNALEMLSKLGVEETTLVIGYLGNAIRKEIGYEYNGMNIKYVENPIYDKTNTSYSLKIGLQQVKDFEKLYVLEGDVFFEYGLIQRLSDDKHNNVTLLEPYNEKLDGTFVTISSDGFVVDWTHKSMRENGYTLDDKYKTINIHRFNHEFVNNVLLPNVERVCKEKDGKEPLENVMRELVKNDNMAIFGLKAEGNKWFEIDDENDLRIAEDIFC